MFRVTAVNGMGSSTPSDFTSIRVVNPPPRPEITSVSLMLSYTREGYLIRTS